MVRRQQRHDNCLPFPTSSLPFPQTLALTPTATPITSFIPGDRAGFFANGEPVQVRVLSGGGRAYHNCPRAL